MIANARAKRERKGCDWIVANDVSPATGIMGGDHNTRAPDHRRGRRVAGRTQAKDDVAARLVARIATALAAS